MFPMPLPRFQGKLTVICAIKNFSGKCHDLRRHENKRFRWQIQACLNLLIACAIQRRHANRFCAANPGNRYNRSELTGERLQALSLDFFDLRALVPCFHVDKAFNRRANPARKIGGDSASTSQQLCP